MNDESKIQKLRIGVKDTAVSVVAEIVSDGPGDPPIPLCAMPLAIANMTPSAREIFKDFVLKLGTVVITEATGAVVLSVETEYHNDKYAPKPN